MPETSDRIALSPADLAALRSALGAARRVLAATYDDRKNPPPIGEIGDAYVGIGRMLGRLTEIEAEGEGAIEDERPTVYDGDSSNEGHVSHVTQAGPTCPRCGYANRGPGPICAACAVGSDPGLDVSRALGLGPIELVRALANLPHHRADRCPRCKRVLLGDEEAGEMCRACLKRTAEALTGHITVSEGCS